MRPVALVTGASQGLGHALAVDLAAQGFAVAVHYRHNQRGAEETLAAILAHQGEAALFQADLSCLDAANRLAQAVATGFGTLDLLVNNAGLYQTRMSLELTEAEWFEGLHSTVTQTYFTCRACLPVLRTGTLKRIINIGDSGCDHPGSRDRALSYHVGKTGVWMLTRTLAESEAHLGVAVNMVSPGYLENSLDLPPPETLPAGRYGRFDDIVQAVRYLALEAPAYLTGSNLVVSGGWNLR